MLYGKLDFLYGTFTIWEGTFAMKNWIFSMEICIFFQSWIHMVTRSLYLFKKTNITKQKQKRKEKKNEEVNFC